MQRLKELLRRMRMLGRSEQFDSELDEEMRLHREMREKRLRKAGLDAEEARYAAQRQVGNSLRWREESRDAWGWSWLEHLLQDTRYGLRQLRKSPGFTTVAILTLALGIGANTAIFSVVNAVLLRPLPYPQPEQLVTLTSNQSLMDLDDIRGQSQSYQAIGGVVMEPMDYTGEAEPIQLQAGFCNAELFEALGVQPELGRMITNQEDQFGAARVVVLSHGFWQRHFGGDRNAVGKSISLSGNSYTIIGVMPADFWMPDKELEAWVSLRVAYEAAAQARGVHFLETYLRLKPGVTMAQAQAEMSRIDETLAHLYPEEDNGRHRHLVSMLEGVVGDSRAALLILFGAVGLVLLIACVNFASLLLARAASRQRETVIRAALGAGSGRLISQMLTESVLLSLIGGTAGLFLARWGIQVLVALKPENLPRLTGIVIDGHVLAFTIGLSALTGIIFGLIPALGTSRLDINEGLKESGRSSTGGGASVRLRKMLVVTEIALATVLLIGAGLLIKSFWLIKAVQPGFRTENLLTMRLELPEARYHDAAKQWQFRQQLLDSLNSLPGVQAAMVSELPMSGAWVTHNFLIDGRPPVTVGEEPELQTRTVAGDYFRTFNIPLLRGRDFTPEDRAGAPVVVVVNESFVRQYFPKQDPIGARIRWARAHEPDWMTIVGVVGDVKHFGLDQPEEPAAYDLYAQTGQLWKRWMWLGVRSQLAPAELTREVKRRIWSLDRGIPATKVRMMTEVMEASVDAQRFNLTLLSAFAAVALVLAAIGIYGVMAYSVTQRVHEIGIRMALGAQRRDVLRLVVGDAGRLAAIGTVLGLGGALVLTRWMASLLYGITARDPLTFIGVAAILGGVAILAGYIPGRRATRVDPMFALRYE